MTRRRQLHVATNVVGRITNGERHVPEVDPHAAPVAAVRRWVGGYLAVAPLGGR